MKDWFHTEIRGCVFRTIPLLLLLFTLCGSAWGRTRVSIDPPGLGMSVQQLFRKWMDACGGEARWKGILDIDFHLTSNQSMGIFGTTMKRNVYIQMQPRLRMKSSFINPQDNKKTIYGLDKKGWFLYREEVPVGQGSPMNRKPVMLDNFAGKEEASEALKGIGFWLGIPFLIQRPGVKLRFAGFLQPAPVPIGSEEVRRPLPMLECDLTALDDWPIDLITVALHPKTFLPVEARYRWSDQDAAYHTCLFHEYKKINGITYPAVRTFYKDGENWEIEEVMSEVRVNGHTHENFYTRPYSGVHWE